MSAAAAAFSAPDASAALPPSEFLEVGAGIREKLEAMKAQKLAAKQKRAADALAAGITADRKQQEFLSFDDPAAQQFAHSAHEHALAASATPATPAVAEASAPAEAATNGFNTGDEFISLSFGDDSAGATTLARASGHKRKAGDDASDRGGDGSAAVVSEGAFKAPWATGVYTHRNFTVRLHEELLDFCSYVSPKPEEQQMRGELIQRLDALVKEAFPNSPNVHLKPFGSYATKLYLPISDIDLVLFNADEGGRFSAADKGKFSPLGVLERCMRQKNCATYLEHIVGARIPILKLTDKATGVKIDICYDVAGGLKAAEFIVAMQRQLPALRPLTLFLKYFLHCRVLNDTYKGGIGSFMLQLMLIGHLQSLQLAGTLGLPTTNLGMLLMSFLECYGVSLNYKNAGLSMNAAQNAAIAAAADASGMPERTAFAQARSGSSAARHGFYNKTSRGWFNANRPYLLSIENPLDASHDVGANSYLIMRVRKALQFAYQTLSAHVFHENARLERRESLTTKAHRQAISRAADQAHPFAAASHTPLTLLSLIVSVNDELRADQVEVEFDELAAQVNSQQAQKQHRSKNVHTIESSSDEEEEGGSEAGVQFVRLVQPDFGAAAAADAKAAPKATTAVPESVTSSEAEHEAAAEASDDDDVDDAKSGPDVVFRLSERDADIDLGPEDAASASSATLSEDEDGSSDDEGDSEEEGSDEEDDGDEAEDDEGSTVSGESQLADLDDRLLEGPNLPQQQQLHGHAARQHKKRKHGSGKASSGRDDFIPLSGGGGGGQQQQRGGSHKHKKGKAYRFDNSAAPPPRQAKSSSKKKSKKGGAAAQLQRGVRTGGTKPNNGIFESNRSKDRKASKKKQDKARKKQKTQ